MKKQSRRRVLALLSALVLLSTLVVISLPASAATGWSGNPGLYGDEETGYKLICTNYAGNVTYTGEDLDMTYGVSFTIEEQTDWLWAKAKDADGNEISNLFWRNSDGKIRGGVGAEANHTDGVLDTIGAHTISMKTEGENRYWYFDDQKINVAITNTAAVVTFEIGTNGSGKYVLSGLKLNEAPAWTYEAGNAEPTITGDETEGYCITGAGNYTATYQKGVNMETGITFSLNDAAGWIMLKLAGNYEQGIILRNDNGYLKISTLSETVIGSATGGGLATKMAIPFVGTHTIAWRAGSDSSDAYRWRIDGVKLSNGGVAVGSEYPMKAAKVSLVSQNGLNISCFKPYQPAWKNSGGTVTKDMTGAYTISGDASFLWTEKVDITKGFEFQLDALSNWLQVTLRSDTDSYNSKPLSGGVNLMLKNSGGKFYASYFGDNSSEGAQTVTEIETTGVHTLKMEKGADGYYRWKLDDVTLCGAAAGANPASKIDALNDNGNGTYIQIGSWGAATLSHIRPAATGETVLAAADGLSVDLPKAVDGETVTVTVKEPIGSSLKAGSLKVIDENGTALAIPVRAGFRENEDATVYTFQKPAGDRVFVTAEYVNNNAIEPNQGLAGWSVNEEKAGLRSVYRMYLTEEDGAFAYRNGKKTVDSFGILLCSESTYTAAGDLTRELAGTTAKMLDTNFAEKKIFWDACGAYVDISVSVINMNETQKGMKLYTRGYVVVDGTAYYTDIVCRSYAEMA